VENGVEHMADITCAVLGNSAGSEAPEASLLQESAYSEGMFSYEDKYLNKGGAQLGKAKDAIIIPAQVSEEATEKMRKLAVEVFTKFECSGTARVDFLYDRKADEIFVNEINTLPGTLYHHLWKASGVSLDDLLARLVALAGERHRVAQEVTTTFDSDILAQAGAPKAKLNLSE
jgi:D-alanine-D-alanine ligase